MNEIFNLAEKLFQEGWPTVVKIIFIGIILIVVNSISHYLKENISKKKEKNKSDKETTEKYLRMLLDSSHSLLSRIIEIIVGVSPKIISEINSYDRDGLSP